MQLSATLNTNFNVSRKRMQDSQENGSRSFEAFSSCYLGLGKFLAGSVVGKVCSRVVSTIQPAQMLKVWSNIRWLTCLTWRMQISSKRMTWKHIYVHVTPQPPSNFLLAVRCLLQCNLHNSKIVHAVWLFRLDIQFITTQNISGVILGRIVRAHSNFTQFSCRASLVAKMPQHFYWIRTITNTGPVAAHIASFVLSAALWWYIYSRTIIVNIPFAFSCWTFLRSYVLRWSSY